MSRRAADDAGSSDDVRVLAMIRQLFEVVDPAPPDLTERVRFAVSLADLEADAASLIAEVSGRQAEPALARGAPEESRTITFDSTELTIMIRIDANSDGTARVDGWLAPASSSRVEIALLGGSLFADADADGRFAFPSVPRGTVRLVVRPPGAPAGPDASAHSEVKTVITPALVLLAAA
jgi:hypothetical protein